VPYPPIPTARCLPTNYTRLTHLCFVLACSYTYHTRQQIHGQLFGKIELTNEAWAQVEEQVASSRSRRVA
jgi:hypothetical protein